jgi:hypothetical protein
VSNVASVSGLSILDLPLQFSLSSITYTAGMPCICIGVGLTMPLCFKACIIVRGNFISLKYLIGGGKSSPSTSMWCFFLNSSCLCFGLLKMYLGGVHLKKE